MNDRVETEAGMQKAPGCCPPAVARPRGAEMLVAENAAVTRPLSVEIPGGTGFVGTSTPHIAPDGEGPFRKKRLSGFRMSETAITNAQFAQFVDETGYITEAEQFGWSFVFWSQVPQELGPTEGVLDVEWWRRVDGATWRDAHGPGTDIATARPDHPVVHVSWADAKAYARWVGGRLPSETEWEHAARAGQGDVRFPWGDLEPDDTGTLPCNIWQGQFPRHNTGADGYETTAPARSFEPNGYGLYNMVGNVWEWTSEPFRTRSQRKDAKHLQAQMKGYKLMKGGSYLCHKSYCYRYRIAARTGNSPDSATTHMGFRVVWDL